MISVSVINLFISDNLFNVTIFLLSDATPQQLLICYYPLQEIPAMVKF